MAELGRRLCHLFRGKQTDYSVMRTLLEATPDYASEAHGTPETLDRDAICESAYDADEDHEAYEAH
jgi:hypothetical protein